jgi:hypothetical protein
MDTRGSKVAHDTRLVEVGVRPRPKCQYKKKNLNLFYSSSDIGEVRVKPKPRLKNCKQPGLYYIFFYLVTLSAYSQRTCFGQIGKMVNQKRNFFCAAQERLEERSLN